MPDAEVQVGWVFYIHPNGMMSVFPVLLWLAQAQLHLILFNASI